MGERKAWKAYSVIGVVAAFAAVALALDSRVMAYGLLPVVFAGMLLVSELHP